VGLKVSFPHIYFIGGHFSNKIQAKGPGREARTDDSPINYPIKPAVFL
jgi:hypothetical protein